jgi:tetratricopeptide (TPR) repeat protein
MPGENKHNNLSLTGKVGLALMGIFLFLVLLELFLRFCGLVITGLQEYRNRESICRQGDIRIICIGESTTAGTIHDSYPAQLEKILNDRGLDLKVSVINKGVSAISTHYLLRHIEENIARYNPSIVIAMMGINDSSDFVKFGLNSRENQAFYQRLQIFKMVNLLWQHIVIKYKTLDQSSRVPESSTDFVQRGFAYICQDGDLLKAQEYFERALADDQNNIDARLKLAYCLQMQGRFSRAVKTYYSVIKMAYSPDATYAAWIGIGICARQFQSCEKARVFFRKAIAVNPHKCDAYVEMGIAYKDESRFTKAEQMFLQAISLCRGNVWPYLMLGLTFTMENKLDQAGVYYKKAYDLNPHDDKIIASLATILKRLGKNEEAALYEKEMRSFGIDYNKAITLNNYLRLKAILDRKGITLVCVQYPMRSVEPLKKMFKTDENVIFVDNEGVFKEAVAQKGYQHCFVDMFGGDFGHCTKEGNRLLSSNIADVLMRQYFKK